MNLIISAVTIIDLTNKEAKQICFSPEKNLLTSDSNHLGKSVIMKSIYYTLGAEVFFSNTIKKINLLTYVDCVLRNNNYRICRFNNSFLLYCNDKFIANYSSVGDLEDELCVLFDFEINLVGKDAEGTIQKCPPAFYYLPYYIDQENGWSTNSFSFGNLTQFDAPQRKNSYFFHLGVFDKKYVEISKRQKSNDRLKSKLEKDNEKLRTVIETLQNGLDALDLSFDIDVLEKNINSRKKELKKVLDEVVTIRKKLVEAEDSFLQLEQEKEVLTKYLKNKKFVAEQDIHETIECPRCGIHFNLETLSKLEKIYLLESLNDDYANISVEQNKLAKRIERLQKSFSKAQKMISEYEKSLSDDKDSYDTYIKSKATYQLLKEYRFKVVENNTEIDRINKDSSIIRKDLKLYTEEKINTNQIYQRHFDKITIELDIPKDQIDENSEPGSSISASGAYGPRCKIAQMLAFIQTHSRVNSKNIKFPLVIDSPNVLEQDKSHLATVMKTLFTWDLTDNQIIVASIEGKDIVKSIDGVKIIELDNPKNHLLSKEDYLLLENEINDIFMKF